MVIIYATREISLHVLLIILFSAIALSRHQPLTTNVASIGLINDFGFYYVGEQLDEIDGPESIYEMSADAYRKKFLNR
jgi:hypothetical protein